MTAGAESQQEDEGDYDDGGDGGRDFHPARRGVFVVICDLSSPARARNSRSPVTIHDVLKGVTLYRTVPAARPVPKLWSQTIDAHRRAVREAVLDTTAALVTDQGLGAVTMSRIASETGIGRATLYKYFSGVEHVLRAWHERQIARHLEQLVRVRDSADDPAERLRAVLATYAFVRHEAHGHDADLGALFHRHAQVEGAEAHVRTIIRELLTEAAELGTVRTDIAPAELATYVVNALGAAARLPSRAAVERLVGLTLAGLRPA